MNPVPNITYELAMTKLDDLARENDFAGTGHRASDGNAGIRVLVGAYLIAFGRWVGGSAAIAPVANSR